MRTETILKKAVAGLGSAALVIAMSACAHHDAAADRDTGRSAPRRAATTDNGGTDGRNGPRAGECGGRRHVIHSGRDLRPGGS